MSRKRADSGPIPALSLTPTQAGTTFPDGPTTPAGELAVIANCPSCGTHYKHEPPPVPVRARCGQCDASLDLSRLRPYRIVSVAPPTAEQSRRAAQHLPIGLDHPGLATTIAENVGSRGPHGAEPLATIRTSTAHAASTSQQVPEMASSHAEGSSSEASLSNEANAQRVANRWGAATIAVWTAIGAVAGFGGSFAMGGGSLTWTAASAVLGAISGWLWQRWPSRN